jgi:hypothetical protein
MEDVARAKVARGLSVIAIGQGSLTLFLFGGIVAFDDPTNRMVAFTVNCIAQLVIGLVVREFARSERPGSFSRIASSFAIGAALIGWIVAYAT